MTYNYNELKGIISGTEKKDLKPGTKLVIPYNGEEKEFVVLGVNVNPNIDEEVDYNFIDIMSTELLIPVGIQWKKEISNIYIDDPNYKFLNFINSDIIKELHSKLELFPKEIQDIVISKKERFLTGCNAITNEKIYTALDIGKVWLPSVKEISNECYMTDSDHEATQYPYFEDIKNRILSDWWWTCSAGVFRDYAACCFDSVGDCYYKVAASTLCWAPLCLRLKIKIN